MEEWPAMSAVERNRNSPLQSSGRTAHVINRGQFARILIIRFKQEDCKTKTTVSLINCPFYGWECQLEYQRKQWEDDDPTMGDGPTDSKCSSWTTGGIRL